MEMEVQESPDHPMKVILRGHLDTLAVGALETRLTATVTQQKQRVILDLAELTFVGSLGLRMFIVLARTIGHKQGKVAFYNPQPQVKEVFEHAALTDILQIVDSYEDALARVQ